MQHVVHVAGAQVLKFDSFEQVDRNRRVGSDSPGAVCADDDDLFERFLNLCLGRRG
jgi:hypothetical protein